MADEPILTESFNEELDVDQKLNEGGVLAKLYLEVQGNDLEAAKKALENTVYNRLGKEENIHLLEVKMYDILKDKDVESESFSGVSEVKIVSDDFRWFLNSILRYGPAAVEIVEPDSVSLDSQQMHSLVADISDFTHMFSQQIISMLKDPERRSLYERMIAEE